MKLSVKSAPYFPAYSLKALNSSSASAKSRNKQFSRVINRPEGIVNCKFLLKDHFDQQNKHTSSRATR